MLEDEDSVFKGMVDESKDRKQLYNSLKQFSTPEVEKTRPEVSNSSPEVTSKMNISGKRKIKVEPFEESPQDPLETSF